MSTARASSVQPFRRCLPSNGPVDRHMVPQEPDSAQLRQCLGLHNPFDQGKNGALLVQEVFARGPQRGFEQRLGLIQLVGHAHPREPRIDLLVFPVQPQVGASVSHNMVRSQQEQVVFGLGVMQQQAFYEPGQTLGLRQTAELREDLVDLIEHGTKHLVFRY
jgi:hypothetical protein